ncbi:nucleotide exchange factor GrpE [Haloferax mediterranei ATCC 33500]|uniref:Protein GrpE n=2 Tax=Haloferax mediterranei (strain ATCC 33500 / DSM 1411 / JCM 8866 / NBRC 14739 / NCIMB 2177 / R-4) TaxID=523841 RepID=GRPE_HALMT|nr:nucleotide exchange factor GrpE [Haloferax mediterranei]Q9HHC2.1 RecName: Full=Protein GrpE; AltName: Full=HSP-70 cofactor [Haloferax mediterranei ATCC 33500]AAG23114.1 heat-shock protein-23 [Haloferax mediterranei ATCC 33500]AFK19357.1 dnaJ/dnaK ATPase stimulator grpE [Haloferax mediterranei ATCC 33500]EMA04452.1 dnaJ/dnaK ATPase stimulator grpE [Haloferax mediterranei ATCC 33500]MDX5989461.1 nucleotide exchange factor GrpE [Haloferax mediterranei ATCC 33500]QCQ75824.1 nucleotide exchange
MSDDFAESVTEANAESDTETAADAESSAAEDASAADDAAPEESTGDEQAGETTAESSDAESVTVSERVAEYDDELAAEVEALEARVADLEASVADLETERDEAEETASDLESRLKRTQADFQNYKKRAKKRQQQIKERATEDFVERVVTVRDNLVRALDQDEDADIRDGIESTLKEFDRILEDENVEIIDPEPGTDVDPTRHEVMMRVESDQPADTIADVFQPGYEMAEKVIRAAQVTVSKE